MEKAVELVVNGLTLRGVFHQPEANAPIPIVILFHGFTGTKLESHRILLKTARALEAMGVASIRFDFSGHGESDGEFENMTLTREIEEARAIFSYVKGLPFVDDSRMALLGFSLGGAIASVIAGEVPSDIKSMVLWAPAGNVYEDIKKIVESSNSNIDDPECYHLWGNLWKKTALADLKHWEIYRCAAPYQGPVLLLHGSADPSIPLVDSERYLALYDNSAKMQVIKGANHSFDDASWEKQVIEATVGFFKKTL
ncbi:MAG TPA: alpha/beta fold hydrolase [Bacillota bacterium]|nr:alpha/beta fold hydrolase [Bacillota bacterium]